VYASIFRKFLFPFHEKIINNRNTSKYLNEYNLQQYWSHEKISELQFRKLKALINFSYIEVDYYNKLWKEIDFHPNDLKHVNDLCELPILTKTIIRENYEDLISHPHKKTHIKKTTGGSTGVPLSLAYTQESYSRRNAVMWRGYSWANLPPGTKAVYLWGTNIDDTSTFSKIKDNLYNKFYNRYVFSCFGLNDSKMREFVELVNKIKPDVIVSYVNPIVHLSNWLLENDIKLFPPKSIITGAEPLYDFQRVQIEEAFSSTVYNTFGCREVMLIASECERKKGLHVNIDHLVVESLNKQGQQVHNESGELVITDLHNYGMPFIRYKNEDLVILSDDLCECGRGLPLMKSVEGRILDCIRTPENKIIPGELFPHYLKDFPGIEKFQVIQEKLSSLIVKLKVNENINNNEIEKIRKSLHQVIGDGVEIDIQIVDEIPLTKSGKHRVTISLLS
jgi:phenylacetate-CoA ligase